MLVNLKSKSQVTIPKKIVERLNLKPGDMLELNTDGDSIVIRPVAVINRSQSWFYSPDWQKGEQEVDKQIKSGKIRSARNLEELYKELNI